ncbi:MAG: 2-nitropropane dioxygenase [Deltaproteobacteria bacterium RIFOXYA12_FULL_61_11]|nr:MAG: 2-nitropropane dioxygenase [Deltaproteobacteria bacterium RIFOXYA12_FULL_61_11]
MKLCALLGITYPIVQGGMIWASGPALAAAVSNAGGLGLLGSGSMTPESFTAALVETRRLTDRPFGVNVPLLYSHAGEVLDLALAAGVRLFFTSAGNPAKTTPRLKAAGATVVHVVSTPRLAKKCQDCGCDAVVAEGFEAGGHNGRDELTTLVLVPQVVDAVTIPVLAAGGIGDGRGLAAALSLGASGVQLGSRFAACRESGLHERFKQAIVAAAPEDTRLILRKLVPVRCLRNAFVERILQAEERGASGEELLTLLGRQRSRLGMLEGELEEGELEIGQISGLLRDLPTAGEIVTALVRDYERVRGSLPVLHA